MGSKKDSMGKYDHSDISVGDVVVPALPGHALRSGTSWYPFAICVEVDPLVLISEEGDMKWGVNLPEMPLRAVGRATPAQMNVVNARHEKDRKTEKERELKAALATVNIVYRTEWTEYEFGCRPDGVSYSEDLEKLKQAIKEGSTGSSEQYWRASDITQALVTPEFLAEIRKTKTGVYTTPRLDHEGFLGIFKPRS